jgi:hypothetical protein
VVEDFDAFLFASVGEERNGMRLTVVSALARRGLDPWQEAHRLAAMSKPTAADRLAQLIALLPSGASAASDMHAIAARLVELLPKPALAAAVAAAPTVAGVTIAPKPRSTALWLICLVLASALLFGMTVRGEFSLLRMVLPITSTDGAPPPR